jgi:hypothetical protein
VSDTTLLAVVVASALLLMAAAVGLGFIFGWTAKEFFRKGENSRGRRRSNIGH